MKKEYLEKIFKILSEVNDIWILEVIYRFSAGMTRREDAE